MLRFPSARHAAPPGARSRRTAALLGTGLLALLTACSSSPGPAGAAARASSSGAASATSSTVAPSADPSVGSTGAVRVGPTVAVPVGPTAAGSAGPPAAVPAPPPAVVPARPPGAAPGCPDAATLLAALRAADSSVRTEVASEDTVCSGAWAVGGLARYPDPSSPRSYAYAQLFRDVDGSWTPVDSTDLCLTGELPPEIAQSACDAG